MPTYTFFDSVEGDTFNRTMTISEMEQFLEDSPWIHWIPVSGLPTLDSVRLGIRKPDSGFTDLLKTIKKGSPKSSFNIP